MNVYDFTVKDMEGADVNLSDYQDKVLLIVNTATSCGFTPQYKDLQNIYNTYKDRNFEILDFPCNQFAEQAKGTDEEIHSFCIERFGITFPQFAKIDVNGDNAIELFKWLTANTEFQGFSGPAQIMLAPIVKIMDKDYKNNGKIKWNFTKFLINRKGEIAYRFEPTANMQDIKARIEELL